jgi:hypothetical protein
MSWKLATSCSAVQAGIWLNEHGGIDRNHKLPQRYNMAAYMCFGAVAGTFAARDAPQHTPATARKLSPVPLRPQALPQIALADDADTGKSSTQQGKLQGLWPMEAVLDERKPTRRERVVVPPHVPAELIPQYLEMAPRKHREYRTGWFSPAFGDSFNLNKRILQCNSLTQLHKFIVQHKDAMVACDLGTVNLATCMHRAAAMWDEMDAEADFLRETEGGRPTRRHLLHLRQTVRIWHLRICC